MIVTFAINLKTSQMKLNHLRTACFITLSFLLPYLAKAQTIEVDAKKTLPLITGGCKELIRF